KDDSNDKETLDDFTDERNEIDDSNNVEPERMTPTIKHQKE
ncbi:35763_t:CDS:1, partial [Gigaspora margarita]